MHSEIWDPGDGSDIVEGENGEEADLVTVDDLSATDVTSVNIDLAGTLGDSAGDGGTDRVVNATNGNDTTGVNGDADAVTASGLVPTIRVLHWAVANDELEIDTRGGADTVDSAGRSPGATQLVVDGALVP